MGKQEERVDWWKDRPWRQIQTNLREIDMVDIDAEQYVAELQEFKANVAMINTSGIIASYPTKLPYHFQSQYLQGDSLEKIIKACHDADIKVVARTDFSKVRRPIYEMHPEWAYISPKGKIVDYNGDVHVCLNSEYQQRYAFEIIKETITTLDVDGMFFNMGGYQVRDYSGVQYGICHCDSCEQKFADMFNEDLPKTEDPNDPVYKKYLLFKTRTLQDFKQKQYKFIQNIRPDLSIANNLELQEGFFRQESNTALDRELPRWQYSASDNTKYVTSSYPNMVSSNTTVDFIDFPTRHVAVSPHQQSLRLAQALANGGALDYYLIGRLDNHQDKSGYEQVKKVFHYHAANEQEYLNLISSAKIGLINGSDGNQKEFRGWFRFLTENHFPFDTIMNDNALNLSWDKYQVMIVPDYQPISDELAEKLDAFASEGGTVIAVSKAGFQDDEYQERQQPALKCLGIQDVNIIRSDMRSAYLHIANNKPYKRLPVTNLLYLDGNYVFAEYENEVEKHLNLIPPQMFGPPERCYSTNDPTEHPGFTVHSYGEGKGVYIPWEPGQLFYRQGYANTIDFIAELLEQFVGIQPIGGNLSPMVEASLYEQKDKNAQLLHLVNGSGHFGISFYEPITMHDLKATVPYEGKPTSVKSLVTGEDYEFTADNGLLTISVPKLSLMESIKIVN
ncbi:beta-galactosidase trimerization domain-containing protein [Aquibacillus albus]|uniref:Beta-galactosidase trimerisation domain-containing protein n=1 Tax=Aquibacillus albus TaxID=1168171 RepID=A0ABS2MW28_9BACI|nr:beta-galactosidase trimerization domain-containing protein [Aquibacillus albus]MBM7570088.1 hypothetical protein [Aquibacillus albus]